MSVDDLAGIDSLTLGADGIVPLCFDFRHMIAGVLGADTGANKASHFVLALCAAAATEILCAKFGVLTAWAGGELKKSLSSPSVGAFE